MTKVNEVDHQTVLEAKTLLEFKSGKKIEHLLPRTKNKCRPPVNPHVKVQALYEATDMIDHAVVLIEQVSSSLKKRSSVGFRQEQRDLKLCCDTLKEMKCESDKAMKVLSTAAAKIAHEREKKSREREDDCDPIEFSRKRCYDFSRESVSSKIGSCTRNKSTKQIENQPIHELKVIGNVMEISLGKNMYSLPKPLNGKFYQPYEIWCLLVEYIPENERTACMKSLIEKKLIKSKLRNAQRQLKKFISGQGYR